MTGLCSVKEDGKKNYVRLKRRWAIQTFLMIQSQYEKNLTKEYDQLFM